MTAALYIHQKMPKDRDQFLAFDAGYQLQTPHSSKFREIDIKSGTPTAIDLRSKFRSRVFYF